MLYDLLAALWDGPADEAEVARAVQVRTGQRFSTQAAQRYLRLLSESGFVRASEDPFAPRYDITTDGSTLLARLARDVELSESLSA